MCLIYIFSHTQCFDCGKKSKQAHGERATKKGPRLNLGVDSGPSIAVSSLKTFVFLLRFKVFFPHDLLNKLAPGLIHF